MNIAGIQNTMGGGATGSAAVDNDFLTQHLGSLLTRQPLSPKAAVPAGLPVDYARGPVSVARHSSQRRTGPRHISMTKTKTTTMTTDLGRSDRSSIAGGGDADRSSSTSAFSPACDDLFGSFFAAPPPSTSSRSTAGVSAIRSVESMSDFASVSPQSETDIPILRRASITMSTAFGSRRKPTFTSSEMALGHSSDGSSMASMSNVFHQPSNTSQLFDRTTSHTRSDETGQTTPPDSSEEESNRGDLGSFKMAADWSATPACGAMGGRRSSATAVSMNADTGRCERSLFSNNSKGTTISDPTWAQTHSTGADAAEEQRKWKHFHDGGVIEPPDATDEPYTSQSATEASKGTNASSTDVSRFTSMTSSRFYTKGSAERCTAVLTDGTGSSAGTVDLTVARRRSTTGASLGSGARCSNTNRSGKEGSAQGSVAGDQLPTTSKAQGPVPLNPVQLVPAGGDGRSFRFVSRSSMQPDGLTSAIGQLRLGDGTRSLT